MHLSTRDSLVASRPKREEQAQRPAHHARPKVNTAVERRVVASPRSKAASLSGDLKAEIYSQAQGLRPVTPEALPAQRRRSRSGGVAPTTQENAPPFEAWQQVRARPRSGQPACCVKAGPKRLAHAGRSHADQPAEGRGRGPSHPVKQAVRPRTASQA